MREWIIEDCDENDEVLRTERYPKRAQAEELLLGTALPPGVHHADLALRIEGHRSVSFDYKLRKFNDGRVVQLRSDEDRLYPVVEP